MPMTNNPPKQKFAIATHYLRYFPFLSYFRTLKALLEWQNHIDMKMEFFKQLMTSIYIPGKQLKSPSKVHT